MRDLYNRHVYLASKERPLPIETVLYAREINRKPHAETVRMADVHGCSEPNRDFLKARNATREKRKKLLSSDYIVRKRQPFGLGRKREKDIYVSNKTNFKVIFVREFITFSFVIVNRVEN